MSRKMDKENDKVFNISVSEEVSAGSAPLVQKEGGAMSNALCVVQDNVAAVSASSTATPLAENDSSAPLGTSVVASAASREVKVAAELAPSSHTPSNAAPTRGGSMPTTPFASDAQFERAAEAPSTVATTDAQRNAAASRVRNRKRRRESLLGDGLDGLYWRLDDDERDEMEELAAADGENFVLGVLQRTRSGRRRSKRRRSSVPASSSSSKSTPKSSNVTSPSASKSKGHVASSTAAPMDVTEVTVMEVAEMKESVSSSKTKKKQSVKASKATSAGISGEANVESGEMTVAATARTRTKRERDPSAAAPSSHATKSTSVATTMLTTSTVTKTSTTTTTTTTTSSAAAVGTTPVKVTKIEEATATDSSLELREEDFVFSAENPIGVGNATLDGAYWNLIGDSRSRSRRQVLTYAKDHIKENKTRRIVYTEEERELMRQKSRERSAELSRRNAEEKRERAERMYEAVRFESRGRIVCSAAANNRLYLSGHLAVENEQWFSEANLRTVINVTTRTFAYAGAADTVHVYQVAVDDSESEAQRLLNRLESITQKIHDAMQSGQNVLVHCYKGRSRSPTVVIAYMVKYLNLSLQKAYDRVNAASEGRLSINDGFLRALMKWECHINGHLGGKSTLKKFQRGGIGMRDDE